MMGVTMRQVKRRTYDQLQISPNGQGYSGRRWGWRIVAHWLCTPCISPRKCRPCHLGHQGMRLSVPWTWTRHDMTECYSQEIKYWM
jgi:hypothetical protein